jgi:monoamine oxidase
VPDSESQTIIVLGAGAAGLAATRALLAAGRRVVLLEARDRPGGRVDTRLDAALGVPIERGAEFVHGRPPEVARLAREARRRVRPVPGRHRVVAAGVGGGALGLSQALLSRAQDDGESVEAFLAREGRRGAPRAVRAMARAFVEGFYLADPRRASAAAVARMGRALESIGADRNHRAEGGWGAVLEPLVAAARAAGVLRLGVRATRVRWGPGRVEVEVRGLAGGPLPPVRGGRLVVTLPVGVLRAGAVRFTPAPRSAARAWSRLEMGPVVKVLLRFRDPPPFDPVRGPAFLHLPGAPVPVFWTLAPHAAPVLVGWAGGPRAERLAGRAPAAVLRVALRGLAPALRLSPGSLEERLEAAEVVDWGADPLAGGGYAVFPPGSAGAAEALARPIDGTLYFAGEATEPDFAGTVAGALRTGERAAREVLRSLRAG